MGVANRPENGWQNMSIHGASASLPQNNSYNLLIDFDLDTWDSYNQFTGGGTGYWDSFSVSITPKMYWDMSYIDPISAPFIFGGNLWGDTRLETSKDGARSININTSGNMDNFLNVVLDTATLPYADQLFPSWGTIRVIKVIPQTPVKINDNP
jgi:hypothetical protein